MPPYSRSPGLAVEQCRLLLQFASANDVPVDACLQGTHLNAKQLRDPHFEPSTNQELQIITNLCAHIKTSAERLGYALGLQIQPHSFGIIGQAMMSSPTLKDALDIVIRYCQAAFHFTQCRTTTIDSTVTLHWQTLTNTQTHISNFLIARDIGACVSLLNLVSDGQPTKLVSIGLPFSDIALCDEISDTLNVKWLPSETNGYLSADTKGLLLEMPQKNLQSSIVLEELCYAQISNTHETKPSLREQIATLLQENRYILDREKAAKALCISSRTLARHLVSENTTWRDFVAQQRIAEAQSLLRDTDTPIELIAEMVGFSSSSAFSLAFRRARGTSPRNYRKDKTSNRARNEFNQKTD